MTPEEAAAYSGDRKSLAICKRWQINRNRIMNPGQDVFFEGLIIEINFHRNFYSSPLRIIFDIRSGVALDFMKIKGDF